MESGFDVTGCSSFRLVLWWIFGWKMGFEDILSFHHETLLFSCFRTKESDFCSIFTSICHKWFQFQCYFEVFCWRKLLASVVPSCTTVPSLDILGQTSTISHCELNCYWNLIFMLNLGSSSNAWHGQLWLRKRAPFVRRRWIRLVTRWGSSSSPAASLLLTSREVSMKFFGRPVFIPTCDSLCRNLIS